MKEERLRQIIKEELSLHKPIPKTYTTQEAAEVLKTAPATLATQRCRGGGPSYHKSGGIVFYTEPDLVEFMNGIRQRS